MSTYLTLDGGLPLDLASNRGWGDFVRWADRLDAGAFGQVAHLAEYGWCQEPALLRAQLAAALRLRPPDDHTAGVARTLLEALDGPAEVVTITNGQGPDTGGAAAFAENQILDLPDIRQEDHFSCGAAAAMAVGRYFGVGPATLPEWKKALGTDVEESTRPGAIVRYLRSLGLSVRVRHHMTIADLAQAVAEGSPVICPVQDYGRELPKEADFDYGHYLAVCGIIPDQYVAVQDSSEDNVTRGSGTIAAPGKVLIHQADWLRDWHDQDIDGVKYVRYGIVVGKPEPPESA